MSGSGKSGKYYLFHAFPGKSGKVEKNLEKVRGNQGFFLSLKAEKYVAKLFRYYRIVDMTCRVICGKIVFTL